MNTFINNRPNVHTRAACLSAHLQPRLFDKFRNRPEFDGLRAVAIIPVVLYHAGFGCTGGYVGVDVFFVISGFLITTLIWRDLENGNFSFAQFWERRARRIIPALVVMTLAVVTISWFLLLPRDYRNLGAAASATSMFSSNYFHWKTSGYFQGLAEEKPLLHTWSLAVEEQFYFIVPFLIWGMFHFPGLRNRRAAIGLIGGAVAVSLIGSLFCMKISDSATFYFLPTRAWELGIGSLLAFLPASPALLSCRRARELFALAGLALILGAVFLYTNATSFPGIAAIVPCLGAAMVMYANGAAPTLVGSLLSARPTVFIGLISYSLYLWHWPFLSFANYFALEAQPAGMRAGLVVSGFVVAILSWRYVELPFRERRLGCTRRSMYQFAGAGLMAVVVCGSLCWRMNGFPGRISQQSLRFEQVGYDPRYMKNLSIRDIVEGNLVELGTNDPLQPDKVIVWGDSHAMAVLPAFDAVLNERGIAGCAATHASTAPLLNWWTPISGNMGENTVKFNDQIYDYIVDHKIPDVILAARWGAYGSGHGNNTQPHGQALLATVRRLVDAGVRPWILLDVPNHRFNVPRALASTLYSRAYITSLCAQPEEIDLLEQREPGILRDIAAAGGHILDPKPAFLAQNGRHYMIEFQGEALYHDNQHLTTKGAELILYPYLRKSFNPSK